MSGKHAILGASSAYRWMACSGSVKLIEKLRQKSDAFIAPPSVYANEGTAAHILAEYCMRHEWLASEYLDYTVNTDKRLMYHPSVGEKIDDSIVFKVDDEMADAVQLYLNTIIAEMGRLKFNEYKLEVSVKPFPDRDDMWGTADVILAQDFGEVVILDYKYGKGVVVDPEYNPQCMYYALGATREVTDPYLVTVIIVQPRAPHTKGPVRRWSITPEELESWGESLRAAADATCKDNAPLISGDHCRFCPVKGACPELRKRIQTETSLMFDSEPLPTEVSQMLPEPQNPIQVAKAMEVIPLLDEWTKAVQGMCFRMLESGLAVPGQKLVNKRATRKWKDARDAERRLRNKHGVRRSDIYKRELKSPTQMEKVVPKKWVERHVEKISSGLTIAPISDKRQAVAIPTIDFPEDLPALPDGEEK